MMFRQRNGILREMNDEQKEQLHRYRTLCAKALEHARLKLGKQELELTEANKCSWYREIGDSLIAHPDAYPKGSTQCIVENIHSRLPEPVTLNPKFSAFENAQLFYKKARKGQRGLEIVSRKVDESKAAIQRFEDLRAEIEGMIGPANTPEEIEKGLEKLTLTLDGLALLPKEIRRLPGGQMPEAVPYRHYTLEGWDIFIGKTDVQNDELTTRFAKPSDIWMHVASHSGSHVVVRRPKNAQWPPKNIIIVAASFAVWFSKAKHTSSCEVHYTEARYVHKRRKSPAGQVVMQQFKSIRVAPKSPQEYFPGVYD
jgi:predicted ribosome quality control (RQC) complex YloA/Tae2 family protein